MPRLDHLPLGEGEPGDADAPEEVAQRGELGRIGRSVHAVHAGTPLALELLGRRDVGGDHELLDQLVAVEADARRETGHAFPLDDQETAYPQHPLEGTAARAGSGERTLSPI